MKSTLRDSIKRLKNIRIKAGKQDEADKKPESTGDPFRDKSNEFIALLKLTKENIGERNAGVKKSGNDRVAIEQSNEIRKGIRGLEKITGEIKAFVEEADRMLAKENRKKKPKADKVRLLERQCKERESQWKQCNDMLEAVRNLDAQRNESQNKKPGMDLGKETQLGAKSKLREQLNLNTLSKRADRLKAKKDAGEEGAEGSGGGKLEDDPETKQHMAELAKQEAEINRGLDRLKGNVGRLHELALEIGSQLDVQNSMLDNTENTVDKQTKQLKGINRRLSKLMKEQSPMNTVMTVACIVLLLGLVGFFLMQFGVI